MIFSRIGNELTANDINILLSKLEVNHFYLNTNLISLIGSFKSEKS
jgi:hypothetical protein